MAQIDLPFINRKRELRHLSKIIDERSKDRPILIVSAETGVGKTLLLDKLLTRADILPIVHVKMIDRPRFAAEDGEYISRLFKAVADSASHDHRLPKFEEFQQSKRSESTLRALSRGVAVHVGTKYIGEEATKAITGVADQMTKNGASTIDNIELYALDVFERCECMVRIENAQKIDYQSLERLSMVLSQYRGVYSILEYTDKVEGAMPLDTMRACFEVNDLKIDYYPLDPIDIDELYSEVKYFPELMTQLLNRYYKSENGNLRVLVDLRIAASLSMKEQDRIYKDADSVSTTRAVIHALGNPKRLLLLMLASHGGEADYDILMAAIGSLSHDEARSLGVTDSVGILQELCEIRYITRSADKVRISHDSILPALNGDPRNRKILIVGSSIWARFYRDIVDRHDPFISRAEALHRLSLLYSTSGQLDQLLWTLEQCGHSALASLAPKRLVSLFDQIAQGATNGFGIDASQVDNLLERQAEILYDANWLDEACDCFARVKDISLPARLMHADACIGTSRADDGFADLDVLEREFDGRDQRSKAVRLSIDLIRLHGLRAAGKLEDCEELFRRIVNDRPSFPPIKQAFILRSSDVGLFRDDDVSEVIGNLTRAIDICKENRLYADEVAARLALSQHLGYSDRFNDALAQLDAAEQLAHIVWIERYTILNNRAVLSFMRSKRSDDAISGLSKALLLATEDGDRLLILANLLAAGQGFAAQQLIYLLEKIDGLSHELAKIAHYNLAVHFAASGNEGSAGEHRAIAMSMSDEPDNRFWKSALHGYEPANEVIRSRIAQGYYLTLMSHWRLTSSTFK